MINSTFTLYEDDGVSYDYEKGLFCTTTYHLTADEKSVTLKIDKRMGDYRIPERELIIVLRDGRQYQQKQLVDKGQEQVIRFERL